MAYSFALSFAQKFRLGGGVSVEDLFQEAWLGVRKAAERFKEPRGRFTTFAKYRIREEILLCVYSFAFGPAEVSPKMMRIHKAAWRASGDLMTELGRSPTPEEVAKHADVAVTHTRQFLLLGIETVSLHDAVSADQQEGLTLLDMLADEMNNHAWAEPAAAHAFSGEIRRFKMVRGVSAMAAHSPPPTHVKGFGHSRYTP